MSVLAISAISIALFFYFQEVTQTNVKTRLFEQQERRQIEETKGLSDHIGSDLDLVLSSIDAMASSSYLQRGDMQSDNAREFIQEKHEQLNPRINRLIILDKNNVVTYSFAPDNLETYLSSDLSLRDWVNETRSTLRPVFADSFERQGIYRIFISYPIVNRDTGEFLGIIAVSIPSVPFFAHYANVQDIESQFLVAFNKDGTMLANGASQSLVGKNFFGQDTQDFINHDGTLNDLTKRLLAGNSGFAVYNYGKGERMTTQSPIYVQGKPMYFIQVVTPTTQIYSEIDDYLGVERIQLFALLAVTLAAVAFIVIILAKWNRILGHEVQARTKDLSEANERLQNNLLRQREFLDIAAHELRTPVQPILGLAQVIHDMEGRAIQPSDSVSATMTIRKEDELLEIIIRNARRLEKLTEDLLDVSRIEAQSLRLKKSTVDLEKLIADTIDEFKTETPQCQEVTISFAGTSGVIVDADKERIIQVARNLMTNALKFTPTGNILVSMQRINGEAIVKVKDNGKGIPEEMIPRLFTKFASKSEKGTGLGLFISKGIIDAHGGRIWAENNRPGPGASFSFTLPVY